MMANWFCEKTKSSTSNTRTRKHDEVIFIGLILDTRYTKILILEFLLIRGIVAGSSQIGKATDPKLGMKER